MTHKHNIGWVTASVLVKLKGFTEDALKSKRRREVFTRDVHYKKFDGAIMYNYEAIDALIAGSQSN
ncbi:excisionase family protein [Shewanella acanthi]|uniref:excisionase family protein n=1 Tax=Shewanella acanthi TaxID=2864212 RepID=UPI001C65FCB5|nr:excisionase family protein [Shewanella acanthi]QYJ77441.1 excisionase family protein [Shewanella acanthi]